MSLLSTYAARGRLMAWTAAAALMVRELRDGEDDYLNDAFAIGGFLGATVTLVVPEGVASFIGWSGTKAWHGVRVAAIWGAPYAGAAITAVSPFAVGYMIGAVAGTAIAGKIWGKEGEQVALGFYSGGLLPGTDAPTLSNYKYILKPTAPGGPVSLYDIAETGLSTTFVLARKWWNEVPGSGYRRRGSPYLM